MNSTIKKMSLSILVIALLALSACSSKYVCYDGTVESNSEDCPRVETPSITQVRAENAVNIYATAYAQAYGLRHHRVNTYREGANWYSEVLFTDTQEGTVTPVTLEIDGESASVRCYEGCEYLERNKIDEDELQEALNESNQVNNDFNI